VVHEPPPADDRHAHALPDEEGNIFDIPGPIESSPKPQPGPQPPGKDKPDVTIKGVRIVDVQASRRGVPAGQTTPRVVEYRLCLADFRDRFVAPAAAASATAC
jgi:hypothetical protein